VDLDSPAYAWGPVKCPDNEPSGERCEFSDDTNDEVALFSNP